MADRARELEKALRAGRAQCPVCLDKIGVRAPLGHCTCGSLFHLACLNQWAEAKAKAADGVWSCPNCRTERVWKGKMAAVCFCGKSTPDGGDWLCPGSCGETCGRARGCAHACPLLCHPGPCPPCTTTASATCHCGGGGTRTVRCGDGWSCGGECGKVLACRAHACSRTCHAGDCGECRKTSLQHCLCGKAESVRKCDALEWQCASACGIAHLCGRHKCVSPCHAPHAPLPCPHGGILRCPCGKDALDAGGDCTVAAPPPCGASCDLVMPCGHQCTERCHPPPCSDCLRIVTKRCACGAVERAGEVCSAPPPRCNNRCRELRTCGRHVCKRRCCLGSDGSGQCPPCEEECGKKLPCGRHRCTMPCHLGPCTPCSATNTLHCPCGDKRLLVPCSSDAPPQLDVHLCTIPPTCAHSADELAHPCHAPSTPCPPCKRQCPRAQPCRHRPQPHECHAMATACPKCTKPCGAKHPCGHECRTPCHNGPCPPCTLARKFSCPSHATKLSVACSDRTVASSPPLCGKACNRTLACGHTCPAPCHDGACPPCTLSRKVKCHCKRGPGKRVTCGAGSNTWSCGKVCPLTLPCGHACPMTCHPPPCRPCERPVATPCACGTRSEDLPCHEARDVLRGKRERPACTDAVCRRGAAADAVPVEEAKPAARRKARAAAAAPDNVATFDVIQVIGIGAIVVLLVAIVVQGLRMMG